MKLDKLLKNLDYKGEIDLSIEVEKISYDSRKIDKNSCFIAFCGIKTDGHNYIKDVIEKKPKLIIVDNDEYMNEYEFIIKVENSRKALSKISSNFYGNPSSEINVIGVTGTNGKTSTCLITKKIMDSMGQKCAYLGTLGFILNENVSSTGYTTPESLELQNILKLIKDSGTQHSAIEVSSHSLVQERVSSTDFDVAVFTNLSQDHLDYHKTMKEYFNAKAKLFRNLNNNSTSVINTDDFYGRTLFEESKSQRISFGKKNKSDIQLKKIEQSISKTQIEMIIMGKNFEFETNLVGEYNVYNIMASIGSLISLDFKIEDILDSLSKQTLNIPGRMELVCKKNNKYFFIDYAHTPDAFKQIFSNIKKVKSKDDILCVFGCGGDRDATKRARMASIAEQYCKKVYVTTDNPRSENIQQIFSDILNGFKTNNYHLIEDRKKAIETAIDSMDDNSVLLVLGKGRENYQIINESQFYFSDSDTIKEIVYES